MDVAAAKEQAEALVRVAETLVAKARDESESIVSDGQKRVAGILADADALRSAAERDAASTRTEAEQRLADARREADALLAEARDAREEAVQAARTGLDASRAAGGTVQGAAPAASTDFAVQEASEVADRILRVARSEAEARSRAVTEEARRRAEIIERDARSRAEVAAKEYRDLVRSMQQAELSAKSRIRELDTEIARLERLLNRVTEEAARRGLDTDPSADPVEPREVSASGIVFPTSASSRPAPSAADDDADRTPESVDTPRPIERIATAEQPSRTHDVDALLARRGIRRRA
ncbi:MAG: hypothetical protein WEB55_05325 [Acidimicrobiia bacterium]